MDQLVIATHNAHKLDEYRLLLEPLKIEVYSLADFHIDEIKETGETFAHNARLKARAVKKHTDMLVLADDSGLEVEALHGLPGVHSKRYSAAATDQANNAKLLQAMSQATNRAARFVAVVCLIDEAGEEHLFEGELHGYIHTAEAGNGGFGYDPVFIPVGHTATLAELGMATKNKLSHRARVLRKVLHFLEQRG